MSNEKIKAIADRLDSFMASNKIVAREVSQRSGLSEATISELRNGADKKLSYYYRLAEHIGMPDDTLFNRNLSIQEHKVLSAFSDLTVEQQTNLLTFLKSLN